MYLPVLFVVALATFCYFLRERLLNPHPSAKPRNISIADLNKISYHEIDMLNAIPRNPTNEGYAVIGGSGFLGQYVALIAVFTVAAL